MNKTPLFARDLMTPEVVTVPPDMPVTTLARMLADRGISSVPVMEASGRLLGIVTEADLLRRVAAPEDRPAGWLRRLFGNPSQQAGAYARTHGRRSEDVMTRDLVVAGPDDTAEHCAHLMERHRIKRLPVVEEGRLLGIVSRSDLLFAAMEAPDRVGTPAADRDARIRAVLRREMKEQPWSSNVYIFADVKDAVVTFYGFVQSDEVRRGLCVMAERIEGVERVKDHLEPAPAFLFGEVV